ncbi:MAG: Holliday junction resolvase RuvX [Burkholderiaceae bacterium]|nr:Holliday junction resolvase RuvX [Burkholderiaceae bacterium]
MHDPARGGVTLMAFDFGERRIGVAIGNTLTGGARPLAVIQEERREARFARIAALIAEWGPERLVVGLPAHPDGAEHPFAARCQRFAHQLQGRFGLAVEMVDERWTSALAPGEAPIDAEAAAILLQGVLDTLSSHATVHPN